jgi:hypothetical protein
MAKYTILQNPVRGEIDVVKDGPCFPIFLLNLICLGWTWAFVSGAPQFGFRIAAITFLFLIAIYFGGDISGSMSHDSAVFLAFLTTVGWLSVSCFLMAIANDRVKRARLRKGFVILKENIFAKDGNDAICQVTRAGSAIDWAIENAQLIVREIRAEYDFGPHSYVLEKDKAIEFVAEWLRKSCKPINQ